MLDAKHTMHFAERIVTSAGGMGLGVERLAFACIGLGEVDQVAVGRQRGYTGIPSISK